MKSSEYWTKRFETLQNKELKNADRYIEELTEQYEKAYLSLQEKITNWYTRLAVNNQVSLEDARKMLNSQELKEFKWTVQDYIRKGKQNGLDDEITKQLENASARVHISKLDAMKTQIQAEIEQLYAKQDKDITELNEQIYSDMYYKSAYEIQKGINTAWQVPILPKDLINKVISKPWTTDKQTFSNRIWKNQNELSYTLQTQLTQALIKGDSLTELINNVSKQFNVARGKASRLVITESAFFSSAGQKKCFEELDVERYEIVATLDSHTSQICRDLDGKVFKMSEYEVGITAPPFHVYCRSVTAPYFDDNYTERIARNEEGKTYYVSSDIKYNEWYETYAKKSEYIIKSDSNYKGINEKLSIKQAVKMLPKEYRDLINDVEFVIITQGDSNAAGNTIKILKDATKYEVIHEIGHIISNKLRINNDSRYKSIIEKTILNFEEKDIIFDPETFTKGIFRIDSKKFVTEYQGRIYQDVGFTDGTGKLNYKAFKDYFPEGLRMYYENKGLLKSKNIELFNYIKDLINNGKNI